MSDEGMVRSIDGRHAICVNEADSFYGWIFYKHPDGQWVSARKATAEELSAAKRVQEASLALSGVAAPQAPSECPSCARLRAERDGARKELAEFRQMHPVRAEYWDQMKALRAQLAQAREALGFAASVIKSGEPWTDTCEQVIGAALASLDEGKEG